MINVRPVAEFIKSRPLRRLRRSKGRHVTAGKFAWWPRARSLTSLGLIVLALFGFAIHPFAGTLNRFTILDFPLGFFMAAQGAPIVFLILIFWFARRLRQIDRTSDDAGDI